MDEKTPCAISAQAIFIESANLTVVGDCPLVFDAAVSIVVNYLSTVQVTD